MYIDQLRCDTDLQSANEIKSIMLLRPSILAGHRRNFLRRLDLMMIMMMMIITWLM